MQLVTAESLEYIRAYIQYTKGYLPNDGGWISQPKKFIEAMDIIENEVGKLREKKQKDAMRQG
ncbi:MAG: hypothetical protein WDL87_01990 [Candidatus Omnitrophota bacterium]